MHKTEIVWSARRGYNITRTTNHEPEITMKDPSYQNPSPPRAGHPNEELLTELADAIESLHRDTVDTEAMAHAAADVLRHMPYLPRVPRGEISQESEALAEARRHYGRLSALVSATAHSAQALLDRAGELAERLRALRAELRESQPDEPDDPARECNDLPLGASRHPGLSGSRSRDGARRPSDRELRAIWANALERDQAA